MSRRKKTGMFIAGVGVATGLAAVLLWPSLKAIMQQPSITVGTPTLTPATVAALLE
jgi:hypothetical protein